MNTLIKNAVIIDPNSKYNGQIADILISKGVITTIGKNLNVKANQIIEQKGLHVSPGWMDIFADFADPGYEYRETLESGANAAAAGGFTDVCVIPNTQPAIDQKSVVEYIIQKGKSLPITVHPLGCITRKCEGTELAEMYDMKMSGAVAFTDGTKPVQSAGVMVKALQYVKPFNGVVIQLPDDRSISPGGLVNEGIPSTRLGLPGRPEIAEEILIHRDIKLNEYAGSHIHFTGISTQQSVKAVKDARSRKINISCSATPYHLFFCDEDLATYDTNLKVNPPLRNSKDRKALQKAVMEGLVDCITSHHTPYNNDHKVVEFEAAKNGMIGLQTAYAVINTVLNGISQEKIVELMAINPRKILGLAIPSIQEGNEASLTLFNPAQKWGLQKKDILSLSSNSPFTGIELTGKPVGIFHKKKFINNQ
ncbi:MAG: dihydroorotase [Niabella sp.]